MLCAQLILNDVLCGLVLHVVCYNFCRLNFLFSLIINPITLFNVLLCNQLIIKSFNLIKSDWGVMNQLRHQ